MCPTYTFIDRATGKINTNMSFKKDYSALISAAWEIDKAYNNYLSNLDGIEFDQSNHPLMRLGIFEDSDRDAMKEREEILRKLVKAKPDNKFRKRMIGDATAEDLMLDI